LNSYLRREKMGYKLLAIPSIIVVLLFSPSLNKEVSSMAALHITSPAFQNNGSIPRQYTCDGKDINPPLEIENCPTEAKSIAFICDDPDASVGTWVHWVLWNIDPNTKEISENAVPQGAVEGMNDFKRHAYGGPCPPSGTHRYFFKVYALDTMLDISPNSTKSALEKAMKGHIIAEGQIIGLYKRG
jgi:Raf kinase inhibitor-like YbhB/YbcL family protein